MLLLFTLYPKLSYHTFKLNLIFKGWGWNNPPQKIMMFMTGRIINRAEHVKMSLKFCGRFCNMLVYSNNFEYWIDKKESLLLDLGFCLGCGKRTKTFWHLIMGKMGSSYFIQFNWTKEVVTRSSHYLKIKLTLKIRTKKYNKLDIF